MNCFVKPNISLPISLHDARVSELNVFSNSQQYGVIVFIFENGFKYIKNDDILQTGWASVRFSGIDFDFSHVYYITDKHRQKKCFEELAEDIKTQSFDILEESYGYNLTKFTGNMVSTDSWCEVEIEIYHFNDTRYEWTCNTNSI